MALASMCLWAAAFTAFIFVAHAAFGPLLSQEECPPGTAYNGITCAICPPNHFQPRTAQVECLPCPSPTVSSQRASNCIVCPPGQAPLHGNECGVCPPGEFYVPGSASCEGCSLNEFNALNDLSTSCEPCMEGFAPARAASCTICAPGEVLISQFDSVTGTESKCGVCESGHAYWPITQSCSRCAANTFSPGGIRTSCEECPSGSFALPGSSSCTFCGAGEVLLRSGCGRCLHGEGPDLESGTCQRCELNHFSDGTHACEACAAGTFARSGSSSCFACPSGTAFDVSVGHCTVCKAGFYYEFSRAQCEQCIGISQKPNVNTSRLCELCAHGMQPNEDYTACVPLSER